MKHLVAILILLASFALTVHGGPNGARYAPTRQQATASPYQTDEFAAFLSARYDFEGNANDTSGNGQHLTASGTVISTNTYTNAYGRQEGVATFDGADDVLTKTNLSAAVWSNGLGLISVWVLPDQQDTRGTFMDIADSTDNDPSLQFMQHDTVSGVLDSLVQVASSIKWRVNPACTLTGQWLNVVLVHDANGAYLYTNTVLAGSDTTTAGKAQFLDYIFGGNVNPTDLYIGKNPTLGRWYDGKMDNVKFYIGSTCSVAHVSWLYTNTHPTNCMEYRAP